MSVVPKTKFGKNNSINLHNQLSIKYDCELKKV